VGGFIPSIRLSGDVPSPFEVLGIDPDADDAEVVDAYRRRVKETHPDHGGTAAEFRAVQTAYKRVRGGDVGTAVPVPREPEDDDDDDGPGARPDAPSEDRTGARAEAETQTQTETETEADTDARPGETCVEYLDYESVVGRGWSLDDEGLFDLAAAADLDETAHGRLSVGPDESLLEAAEREGFAWPYACRGGACANCAVAMAEGELSLPVDHILPPEMIGRGIRLSCVGAPTTGEAKVIFNVKHLPDLDDLRLPPRPFRGTRSGAGD